MRLEELSHRSGVSTATIKYYLRAGLVPPGRRNSATSAAYHEGHLRRLRLVRALIKVGRVPVTIVREALGRVDHASSVGEVFRQSAGLWVRPSGSDTTERDEAATVARAEVDKLLQSLGWKTYRELSPRQPAHRSLVAAVAALIRLGYPWDADRMAPYARLMHEVAVRDLDFVETHPSTRDRIEAALASAVLVQPVLQALHRLAQEEEWARRGGI